MIVTIGSSPLKSIDYIRNILEKSKTERLTCDIILYQISLKDARIKQLENE